MEYLKVIAFTHKHIDLQSIGKLVICDQSLDSRLANIQSKLDVKEIFYLGTCNRVEFIFTSAESIDSNFIRRFLVALDMGLPEEYLNTFIENVSVYERKEAFNHLLRTSCSLESLVVGEKEILAQLRKAYNNSKEAGFTGDYLRVVMERVVKTAKEVYTHTKISKNPVSIVSLAYRKLRELNLPSHSKVLIIGAGETNQLLGEYLKKHKFFNFAIFNRSIENAEKLATKLNGEAYKLAELEKYKGYFDVIITCTGATEAVLTEEIYTKILNGDTSKKVILDLAIPNDTDLNILKNHAVHYIEINSLKEIARKNIEERYKELAHAEKIIEENIKEFNLVLRQRRIELAMSEVPEKIKEIKNTAFNGIFAQEIEDLDDNTKLLLERVVDYMEKKYISIPMVMAKEILTKN
ncbi:MAG: glutamyl-tRNA reductase [Sphingobacteriaceae bacterium]|nr:glutamyl-tRNA reductase [Sphingobacteriaceae bacterium]